MFQLNIRDVREADAHGGVVTTLLHAAIVNHPATVAGAQLVEGGVESLVSLLVLGGHGVGHHLEQLWCVIAVFAESRENEAHSQKLVAGFRPITPQAVQLAHENDG